MALPVLLHAALAAAHALTVEPRMALAAAALLVAVLVAVWRRDLAELARAAPPRADRRRLVIVAATLLVAAAVLPSVVPYDHLAAGAHAEEHQDLHGLHCHTTPASCADTPIASGPGQFMTFEPLLVIPALMATLLIVALAVPRGVGHRPRLRPPMALA